MAALKDRQMAALLRCCVMNDLIPRTMGQGRLYTVVAALHSDHYPQVQCKYFSEVEETHSCVADVMDKF